MSNYPSRIYLQVKDDEGQEAYEITWCETAMNKTDICYLRAGKKTEQIVSQLLQSKYDEIVKSLGLAPDKNCCNADCEFSDIIKSDNHNICRTCGTIQLRRKVIDSERILKALGEVLKGEANE